MFKLINKKENIDTRTKCNIRDADSTLILVPRLPLSGNIKDGTLLTIQTVEIQKKPYLIVDLSLSEHGNIKTIICWLKHYHINILNVAGPRESTCPGIYQSSFELLQKILAS